MRSVNAITEDALGAVLRVYKVPIEASFSPRFYGLLGGISVGSRVEQL
jgi:hypothetical protein